MARCRLAAFSTLLLVFIPVLAMAQTARVVTTEAMLRVAPDANAQLVATIKAGTVLDVLARHGDWYEVWLPEQGGTDRRRVFVASPQVQMLSPLPPAGPPRSVPLSSNLPALTAPEAAAKRAELDERWTRATRQKRAGRAKTKWSIPIYIVGVAGLVYGSWAPLFDGQRYQPKHGVSIGGGAVMFAAGAILSAKGGRPVGAASRELMDVEDERLRLDAQEKGRTQQDVENR